MSSQPWNEFNLTQPPIITIGVKNSTLDLPSLRKTLDKIILLLESQTELEESAAFCSRLLARRKNSFHVFEGFRDLRKVNSALCRLLKLDVATTLRTFIGNLPDFIRSGGHETHLPSQECYDYLMLRMIALQKLYIRVTQCCLKSASYFLKLMSQNYFFDIITVLISTLARIWLVSHDNAKQIASYYRELINYRRELPLRQQPLCEGFKFPKKLEAVPEIASIELKDQMIKHSKIANKRSLTMLDNEAANVPKISLSKQPSSCEISKQVSTSFIVPSSSDLDLGVPISRGTSVTSMVDIKNLKTLESISNFIKEEDKKRKNSLSDSATRNISDTTWKILRKKISQLPSNDNRSAVKLVRNLLGNIR